MYLKSIEVHGFKSFAQKINFEFHNGITGIVGPNGSGKSNVADAVRWVLGEQSAKQLRGGNMQDVIFSGTETRKPLSYASVAITLDNSDHQLGVDFQEVTVTRRLYRSGESEYLINGSACRLRDINEMFYDTGIGKEGYSIIGQGQIDKILSGKPEDRRELFDEAAGIVKFKRRKNMAVKKLEEEQQNMIRLTDILSELTRQLGPLERQSEAAREYLARRDELRTLDVNLFLMEYERGTKTLTEISEKLESAQEQLSSTQTEYEHTREEYDRIEKELSDLNDRIDGIREQLQNNAMRRQQLSGQIDVLKQQIISGEQADSHLKTRLSVVKDEEKTHNEALEKLEEEESILRKELKDAVRRQKDQETRLKEVQIHIQECSDAVEEGKNEIIELLNTRANTKGQVQRVDALMEQIDIRKAGISQKLLRLKTEEAELQEQEKKARANYQAVTERIGRMNAECEHLDTQVSDIQAEIKKQNEQMEIGQRTCHREESRLESLKNITERYEGYGQSIRRVMERKKDTPGILGVAADLIHVEKDYELAIETALGGSIQNIVTDTDDTAKRMIDYLKKNRYGRATFLPLNSLNTRGGFTQKDVLSENGVIGLAHTLVSCEDRFSHLAEYLLGKTVVVDNIDHAMAISRKHRQSVRMVTPEGDLISPGGSMTGGAFRNNSNLLGRRREIEELEFSIEALKKDLTEMQKAIDENRSQRNLLRDTIADLQDQLRRQYVEQNTAKLTLDGLEQKKKELQESFERVDLDQEDIRKSLADLKNDHDKAEQELLVSEKDESELETYIETQQTELDRWKEEEAEISALLGDIRLQVSALEQKEAFSVENRTRKEQELDSLTSEETQILENLEQSSDENARRSNDIQSLTETIRELEKEEKKGQELLQSSLDSKEEQNQAHRDFFEKRDALSQQISLLDKECFRLRTQSEKLEEARENQIAYLWDEYEITPARAGEYYREEYTDRNAMKKEISAIKEKIKALGPVNVNAIQDYKDLLERHTFLSGQYDDLKEAEESLQTIIKELDEGMRRQFSEKFRQIQIEFDKAFKELFGGGKGTLELMEDTDILEAGIRIISQPPGKKLQNMMQLSGGEKALTAIALLFAIQNMKPSPFCLLHEIEAALDDSNVGRFAAYLQKLTKNTQFIIITHRRGTMNAADRLYGITMQEKGVSALVSVDLVQSQLTE